MSPIITKYPQSGLSAEQERQILDSLTSQSQTFIPNVGQVATPSHFYTRGTGYGFYFTPEAVNMAFIEPAKQTKLDRHHRHFRPDETQPETEQARQGMALSLRFIGSNPSANIKAHKEEPGTVNFFIGNAPAKWRTDLHSYSEIVYPELWPNVDMVFRNTGGVLKYEFILQPGANLKNIRLTYDGADNISLDAGGNLLIHTPMGILTEQCPVSYQPDGEQQLPVATEFTLESQPDGAFVFGFTVGADYDPRYPLVIDPSLVYSTYLGGSSFSMDEGLGIATDTSNNTYVTGYAFSTDFPTTPGAFQTSLKGGAFITKLNPNGSLVYSTYLGGSGFSIDYGKGIAIDTSGNAYVTGYAQSTDFPTTPNAFQTFSKGPFDVFVSKLNPAGSALVYSTYLGGSDQDVGNGIAIDTSGHAYVTGSTSSKDFPTTPGAFQTSSTRGGFITKLTPAGSDLIYSTYLGPAACNGIAVDTFGNAYVTGVTSSKDFPTTPGAFQTSFKGYFTDVFVTKLNPAGSALVYSTYLGGSTYGEVLEYGSSIAVDTAGNAYVTGVTDSRDFPTTPGALQTSLSLGHFSPFITKFNTTGSALIYSTFISANADGYGLGIAVDTSGNAYVTGYTFSRDFPTTPGAFQTSLKGNYSTDVFVSKLNPAGSALVYSTYLGGSEQDVGYGIAIDTSGNAYVTGATQSTDFPTTPGAFQTILKGEGDAFVAKLQTSPNGFLGLRTDQL